jgi:hypothetical protein
MRYCQGKADVFLKPPVGGMRKSRPRTALNEVYPLTFLSSHYPSPSLSLLQDSFSPMMARIIDKVNRSDKAAAIGGFLPISLRDLLRCFRPLTYKEDFEELKLLALDLCAQRYEVYRKLSWSHYVINKCV